MGSEALIILALDKLKCRQKDLALRMGVSPTQITKWKKGEYMSFPMQDLLRKLSGIEDLDPYFVLWSGSKENSLKWKNLIIFLADLAYKEAETGYYTAPLKDEDDMLCWQTFQTLKSMGVTIPRDFPKELDIDYNNPEDNKIEEVLENKIASLIHEIYISLNGVYGFYAAYIYELVYDEELDAWETGNEIEACLLPLAASKIEKKIEIAREFTTFKYKTISEYEKWIKAIKEKAFRAGAPLKAELMDIVHKSSDQLDHEAEAESLGVNSTRLHPDVYMNEILTGMRIIHQVLPVIMKKLGIEDFELDPSDFNIKN